MNPVAILGKNIGRARDQTSNLLFLSPVAMGAWHIIPNFDKPKKESLKNIVEKGEKPVNIFHIVFYSDKDRNHNLNYI